MAKVFYSRLCRGLKRVEQTGAFLPHRPFASLVWIESPVLFTLVVYWTGQTGERFSQSFALVDERGNILDEIPKTQCVLTSDFGTLGAANFCAIFPGTGWYYINIFQNGIHIESIPLHVVEAPALSSPTGSQ